MYRKVDSRNDYSAAAESVDCHATATAFARNDGIETRCVWSVWITKEAAAAPCFAAPISSARNDETIVASKKSGFWGEI